MEPSPSEIRAVEERVRDLLLAANVTSPPVDVDHLAKLQGVTEIRHVQMSSLDARLIPTGEGYTIEVNSHANSARQRFSVAHETAHTFYRRHASARGVTRQIRRRRGREPNVEERLCDIAATQMLMPLHLFGRLVVQPSISAISELARQFDASIETTALRFAECNSERVQVTCWDQLDNDLVIRWSRGSSIVHFELPEDGELPGICSGDAESRVPESSIHSLLVAALNAGGRVRDFALDTSGYPAKRVLVEARAFGPAKSRFVIALMQSGFSLSISYGQRIRRSHRQHAAA